MKKQQMNAIGTQYTQNSLAYKHFTITTILCAYTSRPSLNNSCGALPRLWCKEQGRSDGGYISIYTPPKKKNQSTLQIFMWLLVVFFCSLTQNK